MASLLESLGQSLTPEAVGSIGTALGLDPEMVEQGMKVVGPLVQGGVANSASTPQGLDSLMQILTPPQEGAAPTSTGGASDLGGLLDSLGGADMAGNLMGMLTGQQAGGSGAMVDTLLTGLFGSGAMVAIRAKLDKSLGFRVSGLIPLVAPLILSQLRKMTQEQNLDATGVANILQEEQRAFTESGSPEVTLVQEALQAGQDAVALKSKFTPEEWSKIRLAPVAASALVMASAPSGGLGAVQEMTAAMLAMDDSRNQAAPASILNIAFGSPLSDAEKGMVTQKVPKEKLLATLKEGTNLIASKDPNEAAAYRHFVVNVATAVAQAAKEGGLMGFGSALVNKAEKAALDEIAEAVLG